MSRVRMSQMMGLWSADPSAQVRHIAVRSTYGCFDDHDLQLIHAADEFVLRSECPHTFIYRVGRYAAVLRFKRSRCALEGSGDT